MKESRLMSDLGFRGMAFYLKLRERFEKPQKRLANAGLDRGQVVLDYGCGIGSYALPAAWIVGDEGRVYALDVHPLAIKAVERRVREGDLSNIATIHSDRETGLSDESVDVILLYDVLHSVPDKVALLQELYRILKPGGLLSVLPDHMEEEVFLRMMEAGDRFVLQDRQGKVFAFKKGVNGHGKLES
jgi:ubiquinone/menaquinone biosynthesis C-methylase UbiE